MKSKNKKKINIIIVEDYDEMFDRLKQDLTEFSPYVDRIYRSIYHDDIFRIKNWSRCKLIIANNRSDDSGINFFKSFYYKYDYKIYGILHTRCAGKGTKFHRQVAFLNYTNPYFLGIIFKNYASLDKLLELIRNVAIGRTIYPIVDINYERKNIHSFTSSSKKILFIRQVHILKCEIINNLHLLITTITQFNNNNNEVMLRECVLNYQTYFFNIENMYKNLKLNWKNLLQIKYNNKSSVENILKREITYYTKIVEQFINSKKVSDNNLSTYIKLFVDANNNTEKIVKLLNKKNSNGSNKMFLKNYMSFTQSINRIVNQIDEYCYKE